MSYEKLNPDLYDGVTCEQWYLNASHGRLSTAVEALSQFARGSA